MLDKSSLPKTENNFFTGAFIIITIAFLVALGPYLNKHFISTQVLVPCLFIIALFYDTKTFNKKNTELIWFILIFIGGLSSVFYYQFYDNYFLNLKSLFGALLSAYIPIALNKKSDYSLYFHAGYILAAILLVIIMYSNGNFSFGDFASRVDYRDRFMLNANAYSYFCFFGNFSLFFLHQKYKNWPFAILLIVLPALFVIIAFVTQSRGGLFLIILINTVYWLFVNIPSKSNSVKRALRRLIIAIALCSVTVQFVSIYQNSRIKSRIEGGAVGEDSRSLLITNSFDLLEINPIFGVGLGQVPRLNKIGQFSHNSYVEIIAEQGIIGGIMLLMLFGIPLKKSWQLLKRNAKDPIYRLLFLFLITFYIYNNLYVFYKFPFSMMYFFLVVSIINKRFYCFESDNLILPKQKDNQCR